MRSFFLTEVLWSQRLKAKLISQKRIKRKPSLRELELVEDAVPVPGVKEPAAHRLEIARQQAPVKGAGPGSYARVGAGPVAHLAQVAVRVRQGPRSGFTVERVVTPADAT